MAKRNILKKHIQKNYIIYITVFFIFAISVLFGAVKTSKLTQSDVESLKQFTDDIFINNNDVNYSHIFKSSIWDNLKTMIFITVCSVSLPTSLLSFLYVAFKGFSIGFTSGFVIYIYKLKGIVYMLCGVVTQGVLILPVIFYLCSLCINYAAERKKHKENTLVYFAYLIIAFLIMTCIQFLNGIFSSYVIGRL